LRFIDDALDHLMSGGYGESIKSKRPVGGRHSKLILQLLSVPPAT
jgi:hypothetical protein